MAAAPSDGERPPSYFLDDADYVPPNVLFFWSSSNGRHFKDRFGDLKSSKHLPICTDMNKQLIEAYSPKAVVLPGIGTAELCSSIYELKYESGLTCSKGRLVERYSDGKRPWIFTKHWTASFGFSNDQREQVRDYIRTRT